MVQADWRGLSQTEKEKFEREAEKVNEDRELNENDKNKRKEEYIEKLERFKE